MPFGLRLLGRFNRGPQIGAIQQGLNPLNQRLTALQFTFPFSAQMGVQSLYNLLKAAIQRFTVGTVNRPAFVPLFLSAAAQPVRFAPVSLLPVGFGFKLL